MDIDWSTVVFVDVTEVPDSPSCVSGRHIAGTYALRPTWGEGERGDGPSVRQAASLRRVPPPGAAVAERDEMGSREQAQTRTAVMEKQMPGKLDNWDVPGERNEVTRCFDPFRRSGFERACSRAMDPEEGSNVHSCLLTKRR